MSGVEATREVLRVSPDTAVLVLTMVDDDDTVLSALRAGARGYAAVGAAQLGDVPRPDLTRPGREQLGLGPRRVGGLSAPLAGLAAHRRHARPAVPRR